MQQTPQLGQRVLEGSGREQQDRRWTNQLANAMCCLGIPAALVVDAVAVKPFVNASKYLVRLVDETQIERRQRLQAFGALDAAGVLPTDQKYARARHVELRVGSLVGDDAKQRVELVLPLAHQRPRHDDENAGSALG